MTTLSLCWIGDAPVNVCCRASTRCSNHPRLIELKVGQQEITIGRRNASNRPHYHIESNFNRLMISRNHATVKRLSDGRFMLYDHSLNGTFVNYTRVHACVILKHGDIICFGHLSGATIPPGQTVDEFQSDLKYRVRITLCKAMDISTTTVEGDDEVDWDVEDIGKDAADDAKASEEQCLVYTCKKCVSVAADWKMSEGGPTCIEHYCTYHCWYLPNKVAQIRNSQSALYLD
ncbi:Forkhead associated [Echinococcus multilocularis]|uniref:Forkhead associated n=1 Tax=Echinococcus multilocularis TaxID=6211 RepID=A0A068Y397_ECHMU|nr:Forkhead associated [Echinococcus multilocularis]